MDKQVVGLFLARRCFHSFLVFVDFHREIRVLVDRRYMVGPEGITFPIRNDRDDDFLFIITVWK